MKCYIKYKLKHICMIIMLMMFITLLVCAGIMCNSTSVYEYEITGSTFFMKNLIKVFKNKFLIFIILSALLGLYSMDYCNSETEKAFPYKSGKRYAVSYFSGFLLLLISFLLISLSAVFHYIKNYADYSEINMMSLNYSEICRLDSLGNGLVFILNIFLVCITIYSVFGLAAVLTEYRLLSILAAVSILLFPYYIMSILHIFGYTMHRYMENVTHIFGVMDITKVMKWMSELGQVIYIGDRLGNCIGMLIVIISASFIGYVAVRHSDNTSGKFTISSLADRYLIFMVGIYIAFLMPMVEFIYKKPAVVVLIIMAVVFVIVELLMLKLLSKGRKYDYLNPGGGTNE